MEYEVLNIQHQTHSSAAGVQEKVIFTVKFTKDTFVNTAYLEFNSTTTEDEILAAIAAHGKSLLPKSEKVYSFAQSGIIE